MISSLPCRYCGDLVISDVERHEQNCFEEPMTPGMSTSGRSYQLVIGSSYNFPPVNLHAMTNETFREYAAFVLHAILCVHEERHKGVEFDELNSTIQVNISARKPIRIR